MEKTNSICHFKPHDKEKLKWEARFFWPDNQPIILNLIDNSLLLLSCYKNKFKEDSYYLLPDKNYNIKRRHNELLYKPILKHSPVAIGYGSKIKLENRPEDAHPDSKNTTRLNKILRETQQTGTIILVKKEAYIYKFATTPHIKLELARLLVNEKIYFSACIEGHSASLVATLSQLLLGSQTACDYVTFLKGSLL
ncbi:MAG: hypothetical protein ACHP65_06820 [Legionellales bacterium]